jgi:methyl-accepting chemotaxis protein
MSQSAAIPVESGGSHCIEGSGAPHGIQVRHEALIALARKSSRQIANTAAKLSLSAERFSETSASLQSANAISDKELDQFVASLKLLETRARSAGSLARQTQEVSTRGQDQLKLTEADVARIADSLQRASKSIEDLNNRARHLEDVVSRIADIAKQANLLGFNAAIEAARSGAAGRGFAVIAENIRQLATESGESAKQVGTVLNTVRKEAALAHQTMKAAVTDVVGLRESTSKAGSLMRNISSHAGTASDSLEEMLGALSKQSAAAERISGQLAAATESSQDNQVQAQSMLVAVQRLEALGQALYASASDADTRDDEFKTSSH